VIEVKGYPGSTYLRGERKGGAKKTPAAGQARTYFGNALLLGLLMRAEAGADRVALAFPDVHLRQPRPTGRKGSRRRHRSLASRTEKVSTSTVL
jgi:hypothetical protein